MTPQDAVAIFTIISYNKISVLLKSMDHFATLTEELRANNMDVPSSFEDYHNLTGRPNECSVFFWGAPQSYL